MFKRGSLSKESPLSLRDRVFGVAAAFSALYCVAVSFMLSQAEARQSSLLRWSYSFSASISLSRRRVWR
jgi:hypothetical protein